MSDEVTLYDLPSNGHCKCWSLNPWKTRAALNFKDIPYKTEWVEYPDLGPDLKSLGVQPNDPAVNATPYSSPTVRLPDGRFVMDSRLIADELEKLKPSPSLHLDNGYVDKTQAIVLSISGDLKTEIFPKVPAILSDTSAEYFQRTRAVRFGMPLSEFAKSEGSGEAAWQAAEPNLQSLVKLLKENEGPYVAGKQASYADLIIGGWIEFLGRLDASMQSRVLKFDPAVKAQWDAISKYFERADR